MKLRRTIILLIILFIYGCNELNNSVNNQLIARVDNNYLYKSDVEKFNLKFSSESDSIIKTHNFINEWAKTLLLLDRSVLNIDDENKKALDKLVNQYKIDLYNNSYKSSIIKSQIDTVITINQLQEFYANNSSIFLLKEPLFKYRFIEFPKYNINRYEIKERFNRNSDLDKIFLDSLSFQFSDSFRNDSVWFSQKTLINNIPFLSSDDLLDIKKSQLFEVEDTIQVYLLKIKDFLSKNEIAPLSSVENTIRNIVFNQRKLEFLKNFDQEIINDAIQNKKFEIYR